MKYVLLFCLLTLFFVFISRKSISNNRSHGFYRFFAFETILLLFTHDVSSPVAPHENLVLRILTDLFFNGSLVLALIGFWMLRKRGQPDTKRNDVPMLEFEKTTRLVDTGIYAYIRHPMYGALVLLSWAFFLKQPSLLTAILAVCSSLCLFATTKVEEQENLNFFGENYRVYMSKTKRFIPFLI